MALWVELDLVGTVLRRGFLRVCQKQFFLRFVSNIRILKLNWLKNEKLSFLRCDDPHESRHESLDLQLGFRGARTAHTLIIYDPLNSILDEKPCVESPKSSIAALVTESSLSRDLLCPCMGSVYTEHIAHAQGSNHRKQSWFEWCRITCGIHMAPSPQLDSRIW